MSLRVVGASVPGDEAGAGSPGGDGIWDDDNGVEPALGCRATYAAVAAPIWRIGLPRLRAGARGVYNRRSG